MLQIWESIGQARGRATTTFMEPPDVEALEVLFKGQGSLINTGKIIKMKNSWGRVEHMFGHINQSQSIFEEIYDEWSSSAVTGFLISYKLHTRRQGDHTRMMTELPKWIRLGRIVASEYNIINIVLDNVLTTPDTEEGSGGANDPPPSLRGLRNNQE